MKTVSVIMFLCLAFGLGLLVAESGYHRNSPRVKAGMILIVAGLLMAVVYSIR